MFCAVDDISELNISRRKNYDRWVFGTQAELCSEWPSEKAHLT